MKALQLHKPHLVVVVGIPGAGKSFFATQFSDMFHAPYLDYTHYRLLIDNTKTADELASDTLKQLLKTNQTLIVEGIGGRRIERREIIRLAHKNGYEVLYVWIQTDPETAEQRAAYAKTATMTVDQFETRMHQFEPPVKTEPVVVISGKHTHATQARTVLRKLAAGRSDSPVASSVPRTATPRGRIIVS